MERVTVGFEASPPLGLRVELDALERLRGALDQGGWHDLPTADGSVRLNLAKIVYIRTETDEHRVGF